MLKSLVCVTLLFVTDVVVCKPDYHFKNEVDGWLKLHPVPATWQDAFFNCHYEGAVLASPINPNLATALRDIQSELNAPIYLGVNSISQGDFISVEGVPLADLSISWDFYASKTSSGCLALSTQGQTYISSCSELQPYICYKKRDNTTVLNHCGNFDDDYHLYQTTGSCYKYHKKERSWLVAHKICVAEGGHLVVIDNKQEADIVTGFMYKPKDSIQSWQDAVYVGLLDRGKDNSFFTINDVVVCKPDYHYNLEVDGWLKMHVAPETWHQAMISCHYEGAVLASPINPQMASALPYIMRRSELNLSDIYIGANALFSPGDYISIEGVPLSDMNVKWNTYGNGKKPGDCLRLSEDGRAHTTSCEQYLPYVCYKKRDEASEAINNCGTFDSGYNLNEITGSCYKFHEEPKTWSVAYKICAAEGGYLAIINDKQEADAVTALYPEEEEQDPDEWQWEPVHIGLRDWNKDFTWLSIHGEKIETLYNTWAEDQPDNKGVNICGCIIRDGTLDDTWCTLETMFVCEKDPASRRFENIVHHLPYYYTNQEK